jgi:hypothetical protein
MPDRSVATGEYRGASILGGNGLLRPLPHDGEVDVGWWSRARRGEIVRREFSHFVATVGAFLIFEIDAYGLIRRQSELRK